jgi:hypothetical protein
MASRTWKLFPPRPIHWAMKPLDSAATTVKTLDDGRLELTIRHDILAGVTPAMLTWWFHNVEGAMEYMGRTYTRYLIWHPIDHIHFELVGRAADGSAGPGARFHLVEAFGANPEFLVDGYADVLKNDETGITLSAKKLGMEIMRLEHTFHEVPEGTLYLSKMHIGTSTPLARSIVNPLVKSRYFTEAMGRAWLKHNVEETGNFQFFLPEFYAKHVCQGATV